MLCTERLDSLADDEVIDIIAHELPHVASGLPTDEPMCDDEPCEDRANQLGSVMGIPETRDLMARHAGEGEMNLDRCGIIPPCNP